MVIEQKGYFYPVNFIFTLLLICRQLSDVTKDGALSLSEFCTAMHLVVLRRNKIALPKQLPPALDPLQMFEVVPPPTSTSTVVVAAASNVTATTAEKESQQNTQAKPLHPSSSNQNVVDGTVAAQHWTKFVDSPTGSVASPGPQPVNFDFKRAQVEQDPRILHPVALRLTPESQQSSEMGPSSGAVSLPHPSTVNSLGNNLTSHSTAVPTATSIASSSVGKKEPPPPPPPRPYRGHARSSSLDLNQLGI